MREYVVPLAGGEATVLLTDEEAKERGLKPVEAKAKTVANKAKAAPTKRAAAASAAWGGKKKPEE